ncbi:MAG: pyridoxal phosphate-dependent aminotransferase, partial [Candidatus Dormibacteraceae bacterium]
GRRSLREAAAAHVGRLAGRDYEPDTECVSVAGGLNGVLNALLATVEVGQEVVLTEPIYAGLVNRVRLAGGVPRFVSSRPSPEGWSVDPDELSQAVGPRTAALLLMSPAMPTGLVLGERHWRALAAALEGTDAWVLYDAAMERIRFDGRPPSHPAREPGLRERTITIGSASKELRLIGWRVGWVVGPAPILRDLHLVGLTNVVCQVGIAQEAVAAALAAPGADADVAQATAIWARRARVLTAELREYAVIPPDGGWSLLLDTRPLGTSPAELSRRLLHQGKVAATPMDGWGPSGEHYLRLVFANETEERLRGIGDRFDRALG